MSVCIGLSGKKRDCWNELIFLDKYRLEERAATKDTDLHEERKTLSFLPSCLIPFFFPWIHPVDQVHLLRQKPTRWLHSATNEWRAATKHTKLHEDKKKLSLFFLRVFSCPSWLIPFFFPWIYPVDQVHLPRQKPTRSLHSATNEWRTATKDTDLHEERKTLSFLPSCLSCPSWLTLFLIDTITVSA